MAGWRGAFVDDGRFSVEGLPAGKWIVSVNHTDWRRKTRLSGHTTVEIGAGQTIEVSLEVEEISY